MDRTNFPYTFLWLTHRDRLSDRYLDTALHHLDINGRSASIVVLGEILNPWHPTNQLGQQITTGIVREFSRSAQQSFLTRFETALRLTNRQIEEAVEKLDTPISLAAVLIIGREVHFSGIGDSRIFLYRRGKFIELYSGKKNDSEFSALTSGDLEAGDWLIIGNKLLAEALRNFPEPAWQTLTLEEITTEFNQMIDPEARVNYSGILLRYIESDQPQEQRKIVWEQQEAVALPLSKLGLPKFSLPTLPSSAGFFKSVGSAAGKLYQGVTQAAKSLGQGIISIIKKTPKVAAPESMTGPLNAARSRFPRHLLLGGLILLILIGGIFAFRQIRAALEEETPPPTLVEDIASVEPSRRLARLDEIFSQEKFQNLSEEEKTRLHELLLESGSELLVIGDHHAELPELIKQISSVNNVLALLDQTGQLWTVADSLPVKLDQGRFFSDTVSQVLTSNDTILISDAIGNIWQQKTIPAPLQALPLPAAIASGAKLLATFAGNLYIYSPETKTFYRVSNFTGDLGPMTVYVKAEAVNISDVVDWAINGQIVVLQSSGLISDFRRSQAGPLSIQLTDSNAKITTSELDNRIYVASDRTVHVFSADGELLKSVFLTLDESSSDIELSAGGITWLAAGKKLYKLALNL